MPFDEASLAAIAAELGIELREEPYRVRGATVWAGSATEPGVALRVVLWPSLGRVDVYAGPAVLVLKEVESVDVYPGVEVTFRRRGGGYLFVTRAGRANMVV